ncbi:ricin-type beta-trefoil lectin domain protein [Actinoallomurus sp. NPDC050550]|uniref:RICIN domain-containing protein n=1 Tax=Actinoallomurus sp. NPDC050550 TaxID=3154937 RepID=UPI0033CF526A
MKTKYRVAASVAALLFPLVSATAAHANTYQYNVRIVNLQTGNCLDAGTSQVHTQACNGGDYQRWNVTSYDSDVNNYYGRVQIQSVHDKRCLRMYHSGGGIAVVVGSCDSRAVEDQWHITWVGNHAQNPNNSWQFFNVGGTGANPWAATCLDSGQSRLAFQYNPNQGLAWCPDALNRYQIWAMTS